MVFCHKCGTEQIEGSEFCRKCGAKLILDDNVQSNQAENREEPSSDDIKQDSVRINKPAASTPVSISSGDFANKSKTKTIVIVAAAVFAAVLALVLILVNNSGSDNTSGSSSTYSSSDSSSDISTESSSSGSAADIPEKITLGNTYSSSEYEMSFKYPDKWNIYEEKQGNIFLQIIDGTKDKVRAYIIAMQIPWTDPNLLTYTDEELKDMYISQFSDLGGQNLSFSEVSRTMLGGVRAVKIRYSVTTPSGVPLTGVTYMYNTNHNFYGFSVQYMTPDSSKYEPVIKEIADSFTVNAIEEIYAKDLRGMTIGEIESKYNLSIKAQDYFLGPGAVIVAFQPNESIYMDWAFNVVVFDRFGEITYTEGGIMYSDPYVYDDSKAGWVIFGEGTYLDEKIYCGMTFDELKAATGYDGKLSWNEMDECYSARFEYKGMTFDANWGGGRRPTDKSSSIYFYG